MNAQWLVLGLGEAVERLEDFRALFASDRDPEALYALTETDLKAGTMGMAVFVMAEVEQVLLLYSVNTALEIHVAGIQAMTDAPDCDILEVCLAFLKGAAAAGGLKHIVWETARPGLVKRAEARGFKVRRHVMELAL